MAEQSGRLVVVSNRVGPLSDEGKAGGLAVGLADALRRRGGLWFGWSGNVVESADATVLAQSRSAPASTPAPVLPRATTSLTRVESPRSQAKLTSAAARASLMWLVWNVHA